MSSPASANSCNARYVLNDCQCLADPMDVYSTACVYVSKFSGSVYPCDPGCCGNKCDNKNTNITRTEVRPSAGVSLPPGYGLNLLQNEEPSDIPGASTFTPLKPYDSGYKVWQILLIAFLPLILVLVLSLFLT